MALSDVLLHGLFGFDQLDSIDTQVLNECVHILNSTHKIDQPVTGVVIALRDHVVD